MGGTPQWTVGELRLAGQFLTWQRTHPGGPDGFAAFTTTGPAASRPVSGAAVVAGPVPAAAPAVAVVGAHGGAGVSVLALAIAEAAAAVVTGPVRVVDGSSPARSGLVCAATHEVGPDATGWLVAERGRVQIDRPDPGWCGPAPTLRPLPAGVVVVDEGCGPVIVTGPARVVVLVARTTPAGLRAAQAVLARGEAGPDPVLALVGRGSSRATRTHPDLAAYPVVEVAWVRALDGAGTGPQALPRPVLTAGARPTT